MNAHKILVERMRQEAVPLPIIQSMNLTPWRGKSRGAHGAGETAWRSTWPLLRAVTVQGPGSSKEVFRSLLGREPRRLSGERHLKAEISDNQVSQPRAEGGCLGLGVWRGAAPSVLATPGPPSPHSYKGWESFLPTSAGKAMALSVCLDLL